MGGLTGSYNENNGQNSGWSSSVTGGNFTTNNNYDPYVTAYTQNLLSQAGRVGSTPVTPFTAANGVTGNPFEQQLSNSVGNNAVQDTAAWHESNVTAPTTTAGQLANTDLSPYMNPYTREVIDQNAQDIDRTRQMQQQGNASSAVAANAYGGSADALLRSQTNDAAARAAASSSANLRYQGFTNAQDRATSDIDRTFASDTNNANRGLSAMQGNQQTQLNAAALRAQAGQTLLNQSNVNNAFNYNEFLRQQGQPYANVNFMRDAITGLPLNTTIFGNTQNAINNFNGGDQSSSGWGVNGGVKLI